MGFFAALLPALSAAAGEALGHTSGNPAIPSQAALQYGTNLSGGDPNNEAQRQTPITAPQGDAGAAAGGGLFGSLLSGLIKNSGVGNTISGAKSGGLFSNAMMGGLAKDVGAGLVKNVGAGNAGVPLIDSSFMQQPPFTSMALAQTNPVQQTGIDPGALLQMLMAQQSR